MEEEALKLKSPNPSSELLEMDSFLTTDFFLVSFLASSSCISSRKTTVFLGEKRRELEEFSSADLVTYLRGLVLEPPRRLERVVGRSFLWDILLLDAGYLNKRVDW